MNRLILFLSLLPCSVLAQIGTQVVTDDFNRAFQAPIAGNWTDSTATATDMSINANRAEPVTFSAANAHCFYNVWSSGDDQYSQAEITVNGTGASTGMGVCVRHSTTASIETMYWLVLNSAGAVEMAKLVAGAYTSLRIDSVTYVAATKLGLSVTGSSPARLKIWYNGVQIGTDVVDSTSPITTGNPGLAFSSATTSGSADNWDAGTVGVTAATTPTVLKTGFFTP